MTEWLVYSDAEYYPSAVILEAPSREALEQLLNELDYEESGNVIAIPFDETKAFTRPVRPDKNGWMPENQGGIEGLRKAGQQSLEIARRLAEREKQRSPYPKTLLWDAHRRIND